MNIEQTKEKIGRIPLSTVKRIPNKYCTCKRCSIISVAYNITAGYVCRECGAYNNADEATSRHDRGVGSFKEYKAYSKGMPSVHGLEANKKDYIMLRDEHEIRSEMFMKGQTRDSMGVDRFSNTLKRELKSNKCYRGVDKTGV